MIDVVNEPLHDPPSFQDALGGGGSSGWDRVVTSFELARQYCPDAELLINDYGIISDTGAANNYLYAKIGQRTHCPVMVEGNLRNRTEI